VTEREDRTVEKDVVVDDPSLSPEANRALTEEVREAVGGEKVRVPEHRPPRRMGGGGSRLGATLANHRLTIAITFLVLVCAGVIVSLETGSWWLLLAAVGVHAAGTFAVALAALQATTDVEKPAPETVARLEDEGVSNPEGRVNDLVEDFGGAGAARGTAEVASPGSNERTAQASEDPARSTVEQRSALTPGSGPEQPAGEDSAVALLPWGIVIALVVASVLMAIFAGGGAMWIAPAIMAPLGAAWILMERVLRSRGDAAPADRPPGDREQGAKRIVPVVVLSLVGILLFVFLMILLVV
jgi:hypothetical protein